LHILRCNPNLTGAVGFDRGGWTDLSRWLRSGGGGRLQVNRQPRAAFQAAAHGARQRRLAGRLAGGGQQGLRPLKARGKTTKLKRRPRGFHLRAREEGEDAGEEDPGAGRTPVVARCKSGEASGSGVKWRGGSGRLI
jgi:hypothetical protein